MTKITLQNFTFSIYLVLLKHKILKPYNIECSCNIFQVIFDNVDVVIKVSDMTEENQNVDSHDCVKAYVMNRVGGNDLSTDSPRRKLNDVPNGEFLFDKDDHKKQRSDYITLVQRVIVEDIQCLTKMKDCVVQHIPHKHSKEMSKKSQMVSLLWLSLN